LFDGGFGLTEGTPWDDSHKVMMFSTALPYTTVYTNCRDDASDTDTHTSKPLVNVYRRWEITWIDDTEINIYYPGDTLLRTESDTGNVIDSSSYVAFRTWTSGNISSDWVFVSMFSSTEPTFCSWSIEYEKPVCECVVSNPNPVNNSEVLCLNLSKLEFDINSTFGCSISYINISCNGNYTNLTSKTNGTFNMSNFGNLTEGYTYTWYINSSCDGNLSFYWFNFTCLEGCGCTEELNAILYQINLIKGDDFDSSEDGLSVLLSGISIESGFFILLLWFSLLLFGILISKDVAVCAFGTVLFMMVGVFEMVVLTGFMSVVIWLLFLVSGSVIGLYRIVDNKKKVS